MTTSDHADLLTAVLASRDAIDPDLEAELLESIVRAEAGAVDADSAMRGIDAAVSAAIERGVGYLERAETPRDDAASIDEGLDGDVEGEDET